MLPLDEQTRVTTQLFGEGTAPRGSRSTPARRPVTGSATPSRGLHARRGMHRHAGSRSGGAEAPVTLAPGRLLHGTPSHRCLSRSGLRRADPDRPRAQRPDRDRDRSARRGDSVPRSRPASGDARRRTADPGCRDAGPNSRSQAKSRICPLRWSPSGCSATSAAGARCRAELVSIAEGGGDAVGQLTLMDGRASRPPR